MRDEGPTREQQRDAAAARLEILDAMVTALEHRLQIVEIAGTAETSDEARSRLSHAFGWNEVQATAVLDLQVRRFSADVRRRIAAERDDLQAELDRLDAQPH